MNNKDKIELINQNLTELTLDDLKALCDLRNIKTESIVSIVLYNNKLKDLSFITSDISNIFPKLNFLNLDNNEITDISDIKNIVRLKNKLCITLDSNKKLTDLNGLENLDNIKDLSLCNLNLKDRKKTLEIIYSLKNLKTLFTENSAIFTKYTQNLIKNKMNITVI